MPERTEAYREQMWAILRHLKRLLDLSLEQSEDEANQCARETSDGIEVLNALQREMSAIVNRYYLDTAGED